MPSAVTRKKTRSAGPARSAIRLVADREAARVAIRMRVVFAAFVPLCSLHRNASHVRMAMMRSEIEYTSVSVAFSIP